MFDSVSEAESAVRDLISTGFPRDDLSLLASDATGEWSRSKASTVEGAELTFEEIDSGVGTGTVVVVWADYSPASGCSRSPGSARAAAGALATILLGAGVGAAAGG